MKKRTKKIVIGVSIALFLILSISLIYFTQPEQTRHTIITNEGVITFISQPVRLIDSILTIFNPTKQATFSQTTAYVGERVYLEDSVPYKYKDKYLVQRVIFSLYKDGVRLGIYETNFNYSLGSSQLIKASLITSNPGTYTANTELIACDEFGMNCNYYINYSEGMIPNSLTVSERTTDIQCIKESLWTQFQTISLIDNGSIKERTYNKVTASCIYDDSTKEKVISCNDGFWVAGTTNSVASYTGSQICTPIVNLTIEPECSINLVEDCNGKEMISKLCVNGKYQDSGNNCEAIKEVSFYETYKLYILSASILVSILFLILLIYFVSKRK